MSSADRDFHPSVSEFRMILKELGMGAAVLDDDGRFTYCNEVFGLLLKESPASYRAVELEARSTGTAVVRVAFEPCFGWLYWTAVPSPRGLSIRFSSATSKQITQDRKIKGSSLDPHSGLPNRYALMTELNIAMIGEKDLSVMLLEPSAPPVDLCLENHKTDEIVKRIGTALESELTSDERLFRLSPLTLALTFPTSPEADKDRPLSLLRMVEKESGQIDESREPIQFVGGVANTGGAKNAHMLLEQARHALLRARAKGIIISWGVK